MNQVLSYRWSARAVLCAALILLSMMAGPLASATMYVSQTTLVSGTDSSVESFTVTSPDNVTVQLSNIPWPQSLSSLSFVLSSANTVISSWSTDTSTVESFELDPGTYFAHVSATATGDIDLGLYSLSIGNQPAPVPLPPAAALLLTGVLLLLTLSWVPRSRALAAA
ncbi:MAG: hypothetical protein JO184_11665 [Gammaproteobacteria bacterium]|nr:hypothetical protein [Gammaproteobacteria bacterium]MBV8306070.1 hypothetical protein [Gammaproteobacteria bacterium]MBV8405515.1 hypothetical protein [Gammaproteobacteria bacterium]